MKSNRWIVTGSLLVIVLLATGAGINSSIRVADGEVVDRALHTVNGRITIGDGATVHGDAETVNGSIRVGRDAQIERLSTVNGGVEVGDGTAVDGEVQSVNGPVSLGVRVTARRVSTVNGPIELAGAVVDGNLSTYNGDVRLRDGASVGGDIVVEESDSRSDKRDRPLRIEIDDSTLHGSVIVEDEGIDVEVYLRGSGSIAGRVQGARLIEE
jgi:DUF4097 and DUF4098 domain-containing protein YvlB